MPDFEGTGKVILRPGAAYVPIRWQFAAASSVMTNDGSIPFGATITNAAVAVYNRAGTDVTSDVILAGTVQVVGGLAVSALLRHPGNVTGEVRYSFVVTLTLSTGATIPYDCRRLVIDGRTG